MRTVIKLGDVYFTSNDGQKITSSVKVDQLDDDVTLWADHGIRSKHVQKSFEVTPQVFEQQKKILILKQRGRHTPSNIVVPFLYKKLRYFQRLKSYLLSSTKTKQNIMLLGQAQRICNSLPPVLDHKIKYDFFGAVSGRVSANVGVIKRQQRKNIPYKYDALQFDFSAFQPRLYMDYILNKKMPQDPYQRCEGRTRDEQKTNWFLKTFSTKQKVFYQSPFGRNKNQMLAYHLQALQTDTMSRLIVFLNKKLKDYKILMFLYDGLLIDGEYAQIKDIIQSLPWPQIFVGSNVVRYPYKLINLKELP